MSQSEQQLTLKTQEYLQVIIETFRGDCDELETYASFLSQYELSLIPQGEASARPIDRLPNHKNTLELISSELNKPSVRMRICASIQSLSGDVWDIAKSVISSLVALSLSGVMSLPQAPFFLALAAIMIARIGTSALCKDTA